MAKKRKPFIKKSQFEDNAVRTISTIINIELQNQEINGKYKTVFYCKSSKFPDGRMCIAWGRTTFKVGDEIDMIGRIKDDIFLVWKYLYRSLNNDKEELA